MKKEEKSGILSEILGMLGTLISEIWGKFAEVMPKVFSFTLWVLLGIIVLPCVYIAGNVYPSWVEWGEGL